MRSIKPNTSLVGHARRIRAWRIRQKQQDPEGYKNRVNTQRREHRLRTRNQLLKKSGTKARSSTAKKRNSDRIRKRRSRRNRSEEKKAADRELDRNYRLEKRKDTKLIDSLQHAANDTHRSNYRTKGHLESITPYLYTVSLWVNSRGYGVYTNLSKVPSIRKRKYFSFDRAPYISNTCRLQFPKLPLTSWYHCNVSRKLYVTTDCLSVTPSFSLAGGQVGSKFSILKLQHSLLGRV